MALQEEIKTQGDFLFKNRSYLPLIIIIVGLLVYINTEMLELEVQKAWYLEHFELFCLFLSLVGLAIRIITVGHTPKNTSGRNTKVGQVAKELNTTGIYSMLRHPLYLGNFFMWFGVACLTENFWFIIAFIFFYAFYYERIMYAEESFLRDKFGNQYIDWAIEVPAIIPSFKYYKKPAYPFSLRKVLKKEKNGLVAVFLLFWVFNYIGVLVQNGFEMPKLDFWFLSAIITGVIYLILKIMKKRKLLEDNIN